MMDEEDFANWLHCQIKLEFERKKYEMLEELAETSCKYPAAANGRVPAAPLSVWFSKAVKILDFCKVVGGLDLGLLQEMEVEEAEEEEEMEAEDDEDDDDVVVISDDEDEMLEYSPTSPDCDPTRDD